MVLVWGHCKKKSIINQKLINIKDDMIHFNDIKFPVEPMIGVIGVALKLDEVPFRFPSANGSNLDNKTIITCARLYFPAYVSGVLFQCGDLHAAMGDEEINGAVLEMPVQSK